MSYVIRQKIFQLNPRNLQYDGRSLGFTEKNIPVSTDQDDSALTGEVEVIFRKSFIVC